MVKNSIKVYARLKREDNLHKITQYSIIRTRSYDNLIIKGTSAEPSSLKTIHKFRFVRIFDLFSTQSEVFEIIAKPIVNSVIDGFNGTIFAYGQTGSGKTYAITGSSKDYHERGVIPRSIEHVFDNINKSPHSCNIFISYMEIYNEIGYDLLNVKQQPTSHLEELPRVALLEDANGESHFRNLTVHAVTSTQEAMRLLYLGAANRTIVETPMNESSSRSHCIFTIYVCTRKKPNGTIVRSKLHLVDLAGSERVHKTKITGHVLTEAKAINLSLYYLEQVITALRHQSRNSHIPFRNSMMTNMLKDSLTGNCLSSMIATLSVDPKNILETLSTCKFAQRVALVNTDPYLNREIDFSQEVELLREENNDLRRQLTTVLNAGDKSLPSKEAARCREDLERFLNNEDEEFQLNLRDYNQVVFCFNMMKSIYLKEKHDRLTTESNLETIESYKKAIQQKNEEIYALNQMVKTLSKTKGSLSSMTITDATSSSSTSCRKKNEEGYEEIKLFNSAIQKRYAEAKALSKNIEDYKKEITDTKSLLRLCIDEKLCCQMNLKLVNLQNSYRQALMRLVELKTETESLTVALEKAVRRHRTVRKASKAVSKQEFPDMVEAVAATSNDTSRDVASTSNSESKSLTAATTADTALSDWRHLEAPISKELTNIILETCTIQYPSIPTFERKKLSSDVGTHVLQNPTPKETVGVQCQLSEIFETESERNYYSPPESLTGLSISSSSVDFLKVDYAHSRDDIFKTVDQQPNHVDDLVNTISHSGSNIDALKADGPPRPQDFIFRSAVNFEFKDEILETVDESQSSVSMYTATGRTQPNTLNSLEEEEEDDGDDSSLESETDFKEFMKSVPLTGDPEVDDEIYTFYRQKFQSKS